MFEKPESLTATIFVKFHYNEPGTKGGNESMTEIMGRILNQASGLPPELQEVLVSFADYLNQLGQKPEGAEPS